MPKDGRDLEDLHASVWERDSKERNVQSMAQDVMDQKTNKQTNKEVNNKMCKLKPVSSVLFVE